MAKFNTVVNSFIAGEVSPKIAGRSDVVQYNQSCEQLTNMLVQPEGGAFRRSGSELVFSETIGDTTYSVAGGSVLIPFRPSDGNTYAIILCGAYIYQWKLWTLGSSTAPTDLYYKGNVTNNSDACTIDDYRKVQYAQSGNTLVIVGSKFAPMKVVFNPDQSISGRKIVMMYLWDELYNSAQTCTMTLASPCVVTTTSAHGLVLDEQIVFKTTDPRTCVLLITSLTKNTPVLYVGTEGSEIFIYVFDHVIPAMGSLNVRSVPVPFLYQDDTAAELAVTVPLPKTLAMFGSLYARLFQAW